MPETAAAPEDTIDVGKSSPSRNVTINEANMLAGHLITPNVTTYGNGVNMADEYHGNSNTAEAGVESLEVPAIHPQSNTAYDVTTVFLAADPAVAVRHVNDSEYWLRGSSITISVDDKIIPADDGLVQKPSAHSATFLPMHTWRCSKAVAAGTWVKGIYIGITGLFTL